MAVSTSQSTNAVSQRSIQRMREAIASALSSRVMPVAKKTVVSIEPGPEFPKAVPTIPGLEAVVPRPALTLRTPEPVVEEPAPQASSQPAPQPSRQAVRQTPPQLPPQPSLRQASPPASQQPLPSRVQQPPQRNEGHWHIVTTEGTAAIGKHHELLERVTSEKEPLPEVILVRGNPNGNSGTDSLRIRLCNQDGEPTSLEDLELEEVPDVVPFVDKQDTLSRLIKAWPDLEPSTKEAILLLVKAAAGCR